MKFRQVTCAIAIAPFLCVGWVIGFIWNAFRVGWLLSLDSQDYLLNGDD